MNDAAKDALVSLLTGVAVVGIALLMEKPAVRQLIAMRAAHYARVFCQVQADFWQAAATSAATAYQRARL